MLNIVIPMAGRGSRFIRGGYSLPKPLVPVCGVPMIRVVIDNVRPKCEHRFIFLCLKEHIEDCSIDDKLKSIVPEAVVITIDTVTEGAACTVLLAKDHINNDQPLMIANSDQWVDIDINDYLSAMEQEKRDGFIMTMWADDPKWSYIRLNENGDVIEVVEKKVVSNEATVGIYNYAKGSYFVDAAETMIRKDFRVKGEFYVAPAYNEIIDSGLKTGYYNVGKEWDGMYGLGIPSDLQKFESLAVSEKLLN
ncbi:MAG: glycosyltransferase family 2 protein [Desulfobacteraceae bacterium]|nr:glycosyltransferase family 2 protein [Desulfobacteraceae bacterium]